MIQRIETSTQIIYAYLGFHEGLTTKESYVKDAYAGIQIAKKLLDEQRAKGAPTDKIKAAEEEVAQRVKEHENLKNLNM